MKIEVAKMGKMAERGSSLLRLIQNNEMPTLDLLVRESIQNSLDSGLEGVKNVVIDFRTGSFCREKLMYHFEGIAESTERLYPEENYDFIEIRDSNTCGLTGPLHQDEVSDNSYGNLQKLIYQISMPQSREGAGGSWGLGKTVYYRLGMGMVIFYSRIKNKAGEFESRLAACLVEDENSKTAVLPYPPKTPRRGIAWWGQDTGNGETKPLTNEKEIEEILRVTGTRVYQKSETGTTIIIPFIKKDLLESAKYLYHAENNDVLSQSVMPWWTKSIADYLIVAIQRWYAPRISNARYPYGSWLYVSVNRVRITYDNMLPAFQLIQSLYNSAISYKVNSTATFEGILSDCENAFIKPINTRNVFRLTSTAGWISYAKVTSKQLGMEPPDNLLSPLYHYLGKDENGDVNVPIVMYTRKPGMIVSYEYSNRWTDGIPKTIRGEYIVGIFVPNSDNMLLPDFGTIPIEEYLRKCEKADHSSWTDMTLSNGKIPLVERILKGVRNHIAESFNQKPSGSAAQMNLGLGRMLADVLLPPEGFGGRPGQAPPRLSGGDGRNTNPRITMLRIMEPPKYKESHIQIDFEVLTNKNCEYAMINLSVAMEGGSYTPDDWECEDNIGTRFPLELKRLDITGIRTSRRGAPAQLKNFGISNNEGICSCNEMLLAMIKSKRYGIPCAAEIIFSKNVGCTLIGRATFTKIEENIMGVLSVTTENKKVRT